MNVLFLAHRLPYAPNRGDRVRAYHLLREIARWATVDLIALAHDDDEAGHAGDLADVVRSVTVARVPRMRNLARAALALPTSRPTTHSMLHAAGMEAAVDTLAASHRPDVVFCYCTGVAPLVFRPSLSPIPVVLDMVDVDSAKWSAMSATASPPLSWIYRRESRLLRRFEATAMRRAGVTLVVNERERDTAGHIAPEARIEIVENGVDVSTLRPIRPPAGEPVVVFCGVMDYAPNVEGAVWLAREVWPLVRRARPDARLEIVGARPARAVQALASAPEGVSVTGSVPDVRPHLWSAAVSVAPLRTARGVQNKVLEAVAAGLPVVVSPAVAEGLPPEVAGVCATASSAEDFARRITDWLDRTPDERRAHAGRADLRALAWPERLAPLRALIDVACPRDRA